MIAVLPKGHRLLCAYALLFLSLLLPASVRAAATPVTEASGQIVRIIDGDTVVLLTPQKRQLRLRLANIDAPESRQPYGARSRQSLAALIFRQTVRARITGQDRYHRSIAEIFVGTQDANTQMVRQGAAWVYPRYNTNPALPAVQREARGARRGLWALPPAERQPPWEWRHQHH